MLYFYDNLAARLRTKVEFWADEISEEEDILGQNPPEEKCQFACWAEIRPQTGSLLRGRTAETELSRTTHKITIRYRDDVRPEMRIKCKGEVYKILYILNPYMSNERLEIFCEVDHG